MKIIITCVLLLSFPRFIQSLRCGLLRIVESNVGSTDQQSPVADFRSLFDEDVKFNSRGLFEDSLSFSLSMSFIVSSNAPTTIFTKPSAVPIISPAPTISLIPTISIVPTISKVPTFNPATNSTITSDKNSSASITATGNVTTPVDTEKGSKNIALIVVASCALVALAAIVAKTMSKSKRSASPTKGTSTTTGSSINESSSNDVSSVGSTSVSGNHSGDANFIGVQI